jgi:hypothetical protein
MFLPRSLASVLAALSTSLLLATPGQAADLGMSLDAGTTGIGAHLSVPVAPAFNVRVGMNYLKYSTDRQAGGVDYDLKLKLHTIDLLADWYLVPGSQFRLTGGAVYNNTSFDALARPGAGGNYTLKGRSYPAALVGKLSGAIDFRKSAPYLGIGWGNAVGPGSKWRFSADLGATFQGEPKVRLTNTGCTAITTACTMLANDIAQEQAQLADDLDGLRIYPVLRVGITYQF